MASLVDPEQSLRLKDPRMPNCDFYAFGQDIRPGPGFLLTQCECRIYEPTAV